jgi:aminoglycoside phosphotransferase (APT) family kinase protein
MDASAITPELVSAIIRSQFPQYAALPVRSVDIQGHDNRSFRLGDEWVIRMPTADSYAVKVSLEFNILPKLAPYCTLPIPTPVKMGMPDEHFPYPFLILDWLEGQSLNQVGCSDREMEGVAQDLSAFLKALQKISSIKGPEAGKHNWFRGAPVSVYDTQTRQQLQALESFVDTKLALRLWESACDTSWSNEPVWIHGDVAIGNLLVNHGKLSAVIDFGGMGMGDPACDLVIAWTYFTGSSREIFINNMAMDKDTWCRAKAWAMWKASFELFLIEDKSSSAAKEKIALLATLIEDS